MKRRETQDKQGESRFALAGGTPAIPVFEEWLGLRFPNWRWDWRHQVVLYGRLRAITDGVGDRLAIAMPPRHTKSETVTVRYVAWRLIRQPELRVVIACYNQLMADRFSRKVRRIVEAEVALSKERKAVAEWETEAGGGLRAVGVGGGITGQGFDLLLIDDPVKSREEADSEAYRERVWNWYTDDLYTRQEPGAAIVLIMTRWHEDDLTGRILRQEEELREDGETPDNWTVLNLPALCEDPARDPLGRAFGEALCPDRYNEQRLARIRRVLGSYGFNALYQGNPAPPEGGIFKRGWWRFWYPATGVIPPPVRVKRGDGTMVECGQEALAVYPHGPSSSPTLLLPESLPRSIGEKEGVTGVKEVSGFDYRYQQPPLLGERAGVRARPQDAGTTFPVITQSWDMAFKEGEDTDFVVGQVWGRSGVKTYLLDQVRARWDFPETVKAVRAQAEKWPETSAILIEDKANGPAVIAGLREQIAGVIAVNPKGGKAARAHAAAPAVEAGDVYLPHPSIAPWVDAFIEECAAFPKGAHDDQVDAMSQALIRLARVVNLPVEEPAEEDEDECHARMVEALTGVESRGVVTGW